MNPLIVLAIWVGDMVVSERVCVCKNEAVFLVVCDPSVNELSVP